MSTIFDIRNLKLPKVSARVVVVAAFAVVFVFIAAVAGAQLYRRDRKSVV